MENIENFKKIVANNLVKYRKGANLTQIELAEKLNYSDKAVSKWERGENVPDAYVLKLLAELYGISIDDFFADGKQKNEKLPFSLKRAFKNKHVIITLLSAGLVWLLASIAFVILEFTKLNNYSYLAFIYAIPVSSIVCLVLSSIWAKKWVSGIFATITIWTIFLSIFLSIQVNNLWLIFIIAIPIQILVILWYFLIKENKKIKWHLRWTKKPKKQELDIASSTPNESTNLEETEKQNIESQ